MLHFWNVDDKFHYLEICSQHMICKLGLILLFSFHVNYLLYLSWFFDFFCRHTLNDSWKYFELLHMAQPHIILWWYVFGRSLRGDKERSILSLIITSFVSSCLAPIKPPSSGEAMSSFCKCHIKHSSKSFGTLRFTLHSTYVISKVSRAIGDSRKFYFFIVHSTNFCLDALLTCFVRKIHGLIYHVTAVLWTWDIKCPCFVEAFFLTIFTWPATLK